MGNGTVAGTLPVLVAPPNEPQSARPVLVPFTADLRLPLDRVVFWRVLAALVVLGLGVPLALLYLFKWLTARIPDITPAAALVPVTVHDGQLCRDGEPFYLTQKDTVTSVVVSPGRRSLTAPGVHLRVRVGWSPFGVGHLRARADDPRLRVVGPNGTVDAEAVVPLSVVNQWLVLHASGRAGAWVLVLMRNDEAGRDAMSRVVADEVPAVLGRLGPSPAPPPAPAASGPAPSPGFDQFGSGPP